MSLPLKASAPSSSHLLGLSAPIARHTRSGSVGLRGLLRLSPRRAEGMCEILQDLQARVAAALCDLQLWDANFEALQEAKQNSHRLIEWQAGLGGTTKTFFHVRHLLRFLETKWCGVPRLRFANISSQNFEDAASQADLATWPCKNMQHHASAHRWSQASQLGRPATN